MAQRLVRAKQKIRIARHSLLKCPSRDALDAAAATACWP